MMNTILPKTAEKEITEKTIKLLIIILIEPFCTSTTIYLEPNPVQTKSPKNRSDWVKNMIKEKVRILAFPLRPPFIKNSFFKTHWRANF